MVASVRQQVITDTARNDVVSINDALKYCGLNRHLQDQSTIHTHLRSDNIIFVDTAPAYMYSTLI